MFFYIISLTVFVTIVVLSNLIGTYYFSKQKYDNFFVSPTLGEDNLKALKLNNINQKDHKRISSILKLQTILLIVLASTAIYALKTHNAYISYLMIILLLLLKYVSNKYIEQVISKKRNLASSKRKVQ